MDVSFWLAFGLVEPANAVLVAHCPSSVSSVVERATHWAPVVGTFSSSKATKGVGSCTTTVEGNCVTYLESLFRSNKKMGGKNMPIIAQPHKEWTHRRDKCAARQQYQKKPQSALRCPFSMLALQGLHPHDKARLTASLAASVK